MSKEIVFDLSDDSQNNIGESFEFEIPEALGETFGLSGTDIILSDEADELFLLDENDIDSDGSDDIVISDAVILRAAEPIVDTMSTYASNIREVIMLFKGKKQESGLDSLIIPYTDFSFMPEDVFAICCKQIKDIASDKSYANKSLDELAELSIVELFNATRWTPQLQKPEYCAAFKRYCARIRTIAGAAPKKISRGDIVSLLDYESLVGSLRVFEINTIPFGIISSMFDDAAAMASTQVIDSSTLGEIFTDYMASENLKVLTVNDAYRAIGYYLSSQDVAEILHLSPEEILELRVGEVVRQILVYELDNEVIYPFALRGQKIGSRDSYSELLKCLNDMIQDGSIAAAIFVAVGNCMTASKSWSEKVLLYLDGILGFFLAYLDKPALIKPVYYGQVEKKADGYEVSYAVGDKTYSVLANTVLCSVVGDKSGARCVPQIFIDDINGYTVCPPPSLVRSLQNFTRAGRIKTSGSMCYKFIPTTNWLAENQILTVDSVDSAVSANELMRSESAPLLQVLLNYRNKFDSDSSVVEPIEIKSGKRLIYALRGRDNSSADTVCCVRDDGAMVAQSGVLVRDSETHALIVRYSDTHDEIHEEVLDADQFFETEMKNEAGLASSIVDLDAFMFRTKGTTVLDNTAYQRAVRWLCDMCALDYNEELMTAREIVAREFFFVAKVAAIDTLVASRIMSVYPMYAENRAVSLPDDSAILDTLNFQSLQELFDIVDGRPNQLSDVDAGSDIRLANAEIKQALESLPVVTTGDVCSLLDELDFDKIALWMINPTQVRRDPENEMLNALHAIPEIGSRLSLLEHKLIVMRIMTLIGDEAKILFSRESSIVGAYTTPVDNSNIKEVSAYLKDKSKKKDIDFALPLCRDVLSTENSPGLSSLKYYILERNIYGLLSDAQLFNICSQDTVSDMVASLGFTSVEEIQGLSSEEFGKLVGKHQTVRFCNTYRDVLLGIFYACLMNDVISGDYIQIVKAYDLFNSYYDLLLPAVSSQDNGNMKACADNEQELVRYAGSLIISYTPVVSPSADELDGGEVDRFMQFIKESEDYIYDVSLEFLEDKPLEDVRVYHDS